MARTRRRRCRGERERGGGEKRERGTERWNVDDADNADNCKPTNERRLVARTAKKDLFVESPIGKRTEDGNRRSDEARRPTRASCVRSSIPATWRTTMCPIIGYRQRVKCGTAACRTTIAAACAEPASFVFQCGIRYFNVYERRNNRDKNGRPAPVSNLMQYYAVDDEQLSKS